MANHNTFYIPQNEKILHEFPFRIFDCSLTWDVTYRRIAKAISNGCFYYKAFDGNSKYEAARTAY